MLTTAGFNRRMRKTACPVVWKAHGAQSPWAHPIPAAGTSNRRPAVLARDLCRSSKETKTSAWISHAQATCMTSKVRVPSFMLWRDNKRNRSIREARSSIGKIYSPRSLRERKWANWAFADGETHEVALKKTAHPANQKNAASPLQLVFFFSVALCLRVSF